MELAAWFLGSAAVGAILGSWWSLRKIVFCKDEHISEMRRYIETLQQEIAILEKRQNTESKGTHSLNN